MNGLNVNEGYELWVERRKEWTKGHKPYNSNGNSLKEYKNHPTVRNIPNFQLPHIHDNLVGHARKKFVRPVPLSFIFAVYSNPWNGTGSWELKEDLN